MPIPRNPHPGYARLDGSARAHLAHPDPRQPIPSSNCSAASVSGFVQRRFIRHPRLPGAPSHSKCELPSTSDRHVRGRRIKPIHYGERREGTGGRAAGGAALLWVGLAASGVPGGPSDKGALIGWAEAPRRPALGARRGGGGKARPRGAWAGGGDRTDGCAARTAPGGPPRWGGVVALRVGLLGGFSG